jgi:hypothetical protein
MERHVPRVARPNLIERRIEARPDHLDERLGRLEAILTRTSNR